MAEPVRAALIGLTAPHSKGWLQTLLAAPAISELVVCDGQVESLDLPEGIAAAYASLQALQVAEDVQFGLISLPNDEIAAVARPLLQAGLPLIIEKPAGRTTADLTALNEAAEQGGTIWATGFLNRCLPVARECKRLVEAGALGEIVSIEGRMVTSSVQQRNPEHWLFDGQRAGGGILHWLAIHTIDLIRYLSGLEYASVSGSVSTLSGTGISVEDVAALSVTMSNGALGSIHAGYMLKQRYGDIHLALRGTLGEAVWPMYDWQGRGDSLYLRSQAPGWHTAAEHVIRAPQAEGPGYGGPVGLHFIEDFIGAAQQGTPFVTDGNDALRAMQLVEGAYAASAQGRRIDL
ncbi:MAG: hypothetical protein GKR89_35125 [Candidatus Latescibacteria bacterium]|nr:hypothetical protein [Candidatus Latescibacterota bacterium]